MRRALVAVWLIGCGGKQAPREHIEADPAWATSYEARAKQGCACKDAACLDHVHAELVEVELAHGGMDDVPPGVQEAHGAFDQCWRDGTRDAARDFDHAAKAICGCTTAQCVTDWHREIVHLDDKYGTSTAELDAPSVKDAALRLQKCHDAITIPAAKLVSTLETLTTAMCACDKLECAQDVIKQREEAFKPYLDIDEYASVKTHADELNQQYCDCLGKAFGKEIQAQLPLGSLMDVHMSMKCH